MGKLTLLHDLNPRENLFESMKIEELFQGSATQLKGVSELRKSIVLSLLNNEIAATEQTNKTVSMLARHLRMFGKFFRRLQQLASERFALLPPSSDLVMFYWSQIVDSTSSPQNLVSGMVQTLFVSLYDSNSFSDSDNALFPVRFLVQGLVLFKDNLPQWVPVRKNGAPNKNSMAATFDIGH